MAVARSSPVTIPAVASGRRFYVGAALACLTIAVVGFTPTYWIPLVRGTLHVHPLTHVHAVLFYGWLLLFLQQTRLAANGAVGRHRELGVAGVAVATGMCFAGLGLASISLRSGEAAGFAEAARAFTIVPVTAIALFAALFAAALLNVKRPDTHKRLMLVGTASMLQAAVGRLFLLAFAPASLPGSAGVSPPPVMVSVLPGLLVDLIVVAGMIHDRRTRGRVHAAYWIGGAAVLAVQLLRVPVSTTAAWAEVTRWLSAVVP